MSLRIVGNRQLQTVPGLTTRPTSARVRQAVFNILQGQIENCRWLDLCGGVGSMGAEALCRGARSVVGIDDSKAACRLIQANWSKVARPDQTFRVMQADVRRVVEVLLPMEPFDFIYFDPPYESHLYELVLPKLDPLLHAEGVIIAEHRSSHLLPDKIGSLVLSDRRQYGETGLSFYRLSES
jgi:16S rRNA (guanine(966)-N(2))-methyltransferase RsmD